MNGLRRRYLRSAVGLACGLFIASAFIWVLEHPEIDMVVGLSTQLQGDRASPVARSAGQSGHPAAMSLHDAPRPVPELRFADDSGTPVTLADFRGKVVLLNIWATWCGPCREEMPTLDRLQAALGGPDFEVVALSIDRAGIGVVTEFYQEVNVEHLALYVDESGEAARQLRAIGLPTTLLIDRQGREISRHVGPAEWDTPEMVAFFRQQVARESGALRPDAEHRMARLRADNPAIAQARRPIRRPVDRDLPLAGDTTSSATNQGMPP